MLVYSRASRSAGAAALAAILVLAPPASASSLKRASIRSRSSAAPTGVVSLAGAHHRHHHHGHVAQVCLNANTPAASASRQAVRDAVLCLVNKQRAALGLPPLRASAQLTRSAQGWSDEMVASGTFSHGSDVAGRITDAGYDWAAVGENIATGLPTARAVVRAWMTSAAHCQNILNPLYRDLGVGINGHPVAGAASGPATWTQDFGLSVFQSPPASNWRPANGCPYG
jgi:uncharacterized protein YkwD